MLRTAGNDVGIAADGMREGKKTGLEVSQYYTRSPLGVSRDHISGTSRRPHHDLQLTPVPAVPHPGAHLGLLQQRKVECSVAAFFGTKFSQIGMKYILYNSVNPPEMRKWASLSRKQNKSSDAIFPETIRIN
ncbi:hypothetical protein AVEN_61985-1 [Araneus ventricosus]|uniref:Uncharacterized protein n=1 Tax=Araneus ventricosus TaxID=182803 RepID=A0A4Y2L2N9_ARAVE|nr:hypothetical protein AVEN_61985-1 [Araneus ventricosus]